MLTTHSALGRLSLVLKEIAESIAGDSFHDKMQEGDGAKCETNAHKQRYEYALKNK